MIELLKYDNGVIQYNPGKAIVIADKLSCNVVSIFSLSYSEISRWPLAREFQALESLFM